MDFVLSTLKRGVVDDRLLSRTSKMTFFNSNVLDHILGLYAVTSSTNTKHSHPMDPSRTIASLAHEFLIYISTEPGVGICYTDFGWYPAILKDDLSKNVSAFDINGALLQQRDTNSTKVFNKVLSRVIAELKFSDSFQQRELFILILKACPELVHFFWTTRGASLSFEPRSSAHYLFNIALAKSIIDLPIPTSFIGKPSDIILGPPPIQNSMSNIFPHLLTRPLLSRSLQHSSRDVRFACATLLIVFIGKLERTLSAAQEVVQELQFSEDPLASPAISLWKEWIEQLATTFRQRLPDVQIIITFQKNTQTADDSDSVSEKDLEVTALELIRSYLRNFQELWRESRFDFGKLVQPSLVKNAPLDVQVSLVSLLSEVGRQLKLFSKCPGSEGSHFLTLLSMIVAATDTDLNQKLVELLRLHLSDSFALINHADVIKLLVSTMNRFNAEEKHRIALFLDESFLDCNTNAISITESMTRLAKKRKCDAVSSSRDGFYFEFPPILSSLIRLCGSKEGKSVNLLTRYVVRFARSVFDQIGKLFAVEAFHEFLVDADAQSCSANVGKSAVEAILFAWSKHCLGQPCTVKSSTQSHKRKVDSVAGFDTVSCPMSAEDVIKRLIDESNDVSEVIEQLEIYSPFCCSIFNVSQTDSKSDSSWITKLPIFVIIPGIFDKSTSDSIVDNSILLEHCLSSVSRCDGPNESSQVIYMCLLWMSVLSRSAQYQTTTRKRINFGLKMLIHSCETLNGKLDEDVQTKLLSHSFIINLFLNEEECLSESVRDLEKLLCLAMTGAPSSSVVPFMSKVWDLFERLSRETQHCSEKQLERLQGAFSILTPFIDHQVLQRHISSLIENSPRTLAQTRMLKFLIPLFFENSIEKPRVVAKSLLKQLTALVNEPMSNYWQLLRPICDGVSINVLFTVRTVRSSDGDLNVHVPVDAWSILSSKTLISALLSSEDAWIWQYARKCALNNPTCSLELLELFSKSYDSSKLNRQALMDSIILNWTVADAEGKRMWVSNLPEKTRRLAAGVLQSSFQTKITSIKFGLLGADEYYIDGNMLSVLYDMVNAEKLQEFYVEMIPTILKSTISNSTAALKNLSESIPVFTRVAANNRTICFGDLILFSIRSFVLLFKRGRGSEEEESLYSQIVEDYLSRAWTTENVTLIKNVATLLLKNRLTDSVSLKLLSNLVESANEKGFLQKMFPSVASILEMVTSHSQFSQIIQPISTSTVTLSPENHPAKLELLCLIKMLMRSAHSDCCTPELVRMLAGVYFGTTSDCDSVLLSIFDFVESVAFISVTPYILALSMNGKETMSSTSSIKQTSDVISVFDVQGMAHSVHWCPVDENVVDLKESSIVERKPFASGLLPLYDPKCILPLSAALLEDSNQRLDPHGLIQSNILGVVIMCLSSTDLCTRKAAYLVLSEVYNLINDSTIKERNQIMLLLTSLKNGIIYDPATDEPPRIPTIISSFCAQALIIMLKPESDMYSNVNRFLLQRTFIDVEDVPIFYSLIYSSQDSCVKERHWILRLLSTGLKTESDYGPYKRRHVLEILMGLFSSSLTDDISQKFIIETFFHAASIPSVLMDMILKSGFVSFLSQASVGLYPDSDSNLYLGLMFLAHRAIRCFTSSLRSEDGLKTNPAVILQFAQLGRQFAKRICSTKFTSHARNLQCIIRLLKITNAAQEAFDFLVTAKEYSAPIAVLDYCQMNAMLDAVSAFKKKAVDCPNPTAEDSESEFDVDAMFSVGVVDSNMLYRVCQLLHQTLRTIKNPTNESPERDLQSVSDIITKLIGPDFKPHLLEWMLKTFVECPSFIKQLTRNDSTNNRLGSILWHLVTFMDRSGSQETDRMFHMAQCSILLILREWSQMDVKIRQSLKPIESVIPLIPSPKKLLASNCQNTIGILYEQIVIRKDIYRLLLNR